MPQARDLGRFLQQTTPRERAVRGLPAGAELPGRIGPVEFPYAQRAFDLCGGTT
jgi:hypothetical protein